MYRGLSPHKITPMSGVLHTKRRWCAVSTWLDHSRRSVIADVMSLKRNRIQFRISHLFSTYRCGRTCSRFPCCFNRNHKRQPCFAVRNLHFSADHGNNDLAGRRTANRRNCLWCIWRICDSAFTSCRVLDGNRCYRICLAWTTIPALPFICNKLYRCAVWLYNNSVRSFVSCIFVSKKFKFECIASDAVTRDNNAMDPSRISRRF